MSLQNICNPVSYGGLTTIFQTIQMPTTLWEKLSEASDRNAKNAQHYLSKYCELQRLLTAANLSIQNHKNENYRLKSASNRINNELNKANKELKDIKIKYSIVEILNKDLTSKLENKTQSYEMISQDYKISNETNERLLQQIPRLELELRNERMRYDTEKQNSDRILEELRESVSNSNQKIQTLTEKHQKYIFDLKRRHYEESNLIKEKLQESENKLKEMRSTYSDTSELSSDTPLSSDDESN